MGFENEISRWSLGFSIDGEISVEQGEKSEEGFWCFSVFCFCFLDMETELAKKEGHIGYKIITQLKVYESQIIFRVSIVILKMSKLSSQFLIFPILVTDNILFPFSFTKIIIFMVGTICTNGNESFYEHIAYVYWFHHYPFLHPFMVMITLFDLILVYFTYF